IRRQSPRWPLTVFAYQILRSSKWKQEVGPDARAPSYTMPMWIAPTQAVHYGEIFATALSGGTWTGRPRGNSRKEALAHQVCRLRATQTPVGLDDCQIDLFRKQPGPDLAGGRVIDPADATGKTRGRRGVYSEHSCSAIEGVFRHGDQVRAERVLGARSYVAVG